MTLQRKSVGISLIDLLSAEAAETEITIETQRIKKERISYTFCFFLHLILIGYRKNKLPTTLAD